MFEYKYFFRSLGRNRIHTAITIIGFSLSMAVVMLLSAYIKSEKSVNRQYPNSDAIYLLVKDDQSALIPESLLSKLRNDIPGIENATLWNTSKMKFGAENMEGQVLSADEAFLKMFSVKLLKGDARAIKQKNHVLITQAFAKKLFGEKDPVGEKINDHLIVAGVMAPATYLSGFQYDVLISREAKAYANTFGGMNTFEDFYAGAIQVNGKTNLDSIRSKINLFGKQNEILSEKKTILTLKSLKDVYFDSEIKDDSMSHANSAMIRLLFYVTLAISLLAIFNYINLTTARGLSRFREVGIQKTLGAGKGTIFRQFLSETYLLCLISIALAWGIAVVAQPLFESILEKEINIQILFGDQQSTLLFLLFFLIIGLVSGIAPAVSASRFNPISLIGMNAPGIKGYSVRSLMSVFQFTVSIVLIIALLMVFRQVHFLKSKNLGFDQEQLISIELNGLDYSKQNVIRQKMLENPSITDASLSYGGPGSIMGSMTWRDEKGNSNEVGYISVDTNFIKTFGIKLLKGQNLTTVWNEGMLINETFYKKMGWTTIEGKDFNGDKIIGVVRDFHCKNLHQPIYPIGLRPLVDAGSLLNLKLKAENMDQTLKYIQKTYAEFQNGASFKYKFYDEWFDSMYKQEENQAAAIRIFTVLAILISCLGLLGLAEFEVRNKTREIGIRRVNGASVAGILFMLNKKFLIPVLVAFIIACPIASYLIEKWLESFAYKAEMSWWIYALGGIMALFIALLTVRLQSWQAATRNPVESLKSE